MRTFAILTTVANATMRKLLNRVDDPNAPPPSDALAGANPA